MTGNETVVAYFKSPSEAERALNNLRDAGFNRDRTGFVNSSRYNESSPETNLTNANQSPHSEGLWARIVHFFEDDSTSGTTSAAANQKRELGTSDIDDIEMGNNDDTDMGNNNDDLYDHEEWTGSLGSMGLSGERSSTSSISLIMDKKAR
jgi:hypothetical protein